VIETSLVDDADSKLIAEPTADLDGWAAGRARQQDPASVYATYWQARSGFFNLAPKPRTSSIEPMRRSNL
jgi:hypothetical protein